MKRSLILFFLIIQTAISSGQPCDTNSLIQRSIKAFTTDNNIAFEIQNHQVFINSDCIQNDKLVIHLVGSFDNPSSTILFPSIAANNGYKAISLKYTNSTAAVSACGNSNNSDCFQNFRQEIVFGEDVSLVVEVNEDNCIINRIQKLLTYLDNNFPSENWSNFLTSSEEINWSNIVISGHSQGGGHAAYIAKQFEVDRALMFASPNDYSNFFSAPANWISSPSETPDSNYYAFGNLFDEVVDFSKQYQVWSDLNILLDSDSINVDISECNFNNSNVLYTQYESSALISGHHSSVIIDNFTPESSGIPEFIDVWKYMLGICEVVTNVSDLGNEDLSIEVFPNPSNSKLYVDNDNIISKVEIFTTSGKRLDVTHPMKRNFQLDLDQYRGMLILKFSIKDSNKTISKFVTIEGN